ncbi:MAG: signal peptidase I [Oscillospiraceae bacterium]|jgi:signal peptidase I|nr:signal peptidase I [Oscillospiraceae bacterium]
MRAAREYWVPLQTRQKAEKAPSWLLRTLYDALSSLTAGLLVISLVFCFVGRPVRVYGSSMQPTLQHGDWVLVRLTPRLERGRIAVMYEGTHLKKPIIKRVIALPGDTVDIDFVSGVVCVNGAALKEPYTAAPTRRKADVRFPLTVAEGTCFVLGDNRNHSQDSRFSEVGLVDQRSVLGQVLFHASFARR